MSISKGLFIGFLVDRRFARGVRAWASLGVFYYARPGMGCRNSQMRWRPFQVPGDSRA